MYLFRQHMAEVSGMELLVHTNPEAIAKDINPFDHGSALHTDITKTQGLKQALDQYRFDVVFGGARGTKRSPGPRSGSFSFRTATHSWDPKNQRPELWNLYNAQKRPEKAFASSPSPTGPRWIFGSTSTRSRFPSCPLLREGTPCGGAWDGLILMVDDDRFRLAPGEEIQFRFVRFRTLGCYPLTGGVESDAQSAGHHRGAHPVPKLGTPGAGHRQRRRRQHGEEEAGGVFLMTTAMRAADRQAAFESFLAEQREQDLLRFITCGSVDDGKSTLIGRLLWDAQQLYDDQLAALSAESKRYGTQGDDIDFALLVDGLAAEREQGITIDVAYRFFATQRQVHCGRYARSRAVHRNMVTGASTAQVAVLLIDARQGVLTQTRRHAYLVSLVGLSTLYSLSIRWIWSTTIRGRQRP